MHSIHAMNPHNGSTKEIDVNSSHHQAMHVERIPNTLQKVWVLGSQQIKQKNTFSQYQDGYGRRVQGGLGVEAAYFAELNALAIQCHPEWLYHDKDRYSETFAVLEQWYECLVKNKFPKLFRQHLQNSGMCSSNGANPWVMKKASDIPTEIPPLVDVTVMKGGVLTEELLNEIINKLFEEQANPSPLPPLPISELVLADAPYIPQPNPNWGTTFSQFYTTGQDPFAPESTITTSQIVTELAVPDWDMSLTDGEDEDEGSLEEQAGQTETGPLGPTPW